MLETLLTRIGYDPQIVPGLPIDGITKALGTVQSAIDALTDPPDVSVAGLQAAIESVGRVVAAVRALESGLPAQLAGMGADLLAASADIWLFSRHPRWGNAASLLGLYTDSAGTLTRPAVFDPATGDLLRTEHRLPIVHFDRLLALLKDPKAELTALYFGPRPLETAADAKLAADSFFPGVQRLFQDLGFNAWYGLSAEERTALAIDAPTAADDMLTVQLPLAGGGEIGASFAFSSRDQGDLGLVVVPHGSVALERELANWSLSLALSAGTQALSVGRNGLQLLGSAELQAKVEAALHGKDGPAIVFGDPGATRLEIGDLRLSASLAGTAGKRPVVDLLAAIRRGALVLAPEGSGFLGALLPEEGVRIDFRTGLGWTTGRGLHLEGSASLDTPLPSIGAAGVVGVEALRLKIEPGDDGVLAGLSGSVFGSIGGVLSARVDGLGIAATLRRPAGGAGNLGGLDLRVAVESPTGAALVLDAGPVKGGGSLDHDPQQKRWTGAMQVEIGSLSVDAFGLLDELPAGYSLLVLLSAAFPSIELGWGFTLDGVGGVLGANRSVSIDALRSALKARTLDSVLFPADPAAQAEQLTGDLEAMFPPAPGRFVFGPMAKLGWGTPTLATIRLALVMELPKPPRLALLGILRSLLPSEDEAFVRLQVNAIGYADFGAKVAGFEASLFDSTLTGLVLSGDLAARFAWGDAPSFALSIGGFHPQFPTPSGFPSLSRVSVSLATGDPEVRLSGYLAVTSNTVQLGARLDFHLSAVGADVRGALSFDALVQFSPFHFQVDVLGYVSLSIASVSIASLSVHLSISGPHPWHAKGEVSIGILFWSIDVPVEFTIGSPEPEKLPPPIAVAPLVVAALVDGKSVTVSGDATALVPRGPDAGASTRVPPIGRMTVRQLVAPLRVTMDHFGARRLERPTRLEISVSCDAGTIPVSYEGDLFAPGQFVSMSDAEKLRAPGFEKLDAGVSFELDVPVIEEGAIAFHRVTYVVDVQQPDGSILRAAAATAGTPALVAASAAAPQPAAEALGLALHPRSFVAATVDAMSIIGTRGAWIAAREAASGRTLQVIEQWEATYRRPR